MATEPGANDVDGPQFRGLFVGINRYQSPDISNLASAVRDATALQALFADNLGEDCALITDRDATSERLRTELAILASSSGENDTVVIAFSGHGSDTTNSSRSTPTRTTLRRRRSRSTN